MNKNCSNCIHSCICRLWNEAEWSDACKYAGNENFFGWHDVKKELPTPYAYVLCVGARGGYFIGYCTEKNNLLFKTATRHTPRRAVWWIDLPKRPEGMK